MYTQFVKRSIVHFGCLFLIAILLTGCGGIMNSRDAIDKLAEIIEGGNTATWR